MKTAIGIGVIAVVTAVVAAVLVARGDEPDVVRAKVEADGGLTFVGEGDARTEPLDIPSGEYSVVAGCGDEDRFVLTLVAGGASERLLGSTGLVSVSIPRGAVLEVVCPGRWGVVVDDPLPWP